MFATVLIFAAVLMGWCSYASAHGAVDFWTIDRRISFCFIYMAFAFCAMSVFAVWDAVRRIAKAIPPVHEG